MSESSSENQPQSDGESVTPQITGKQAQRINAPARAMIFSMLALLLIMLPVYWLQPHPDKTSYKPEVNVSEIASEAKESSGFDVAAPDPGKGWTPNFARWNKGGSDGVAYWETGWVTPSQGFITLTQTNKSNPTWTSQRTENAVPTGNVEAAGIHWETRTHESEGNKDEGTKTAWVGTVDGTEVVLYGHAEDSEFQHMAQAVVDSVGQNAKK